jgi:hypothetical protein
MNMAQLEEKVLALEKAVAELRARNGGPDKAMQPEGMAARISGEAEIIPGAEYDLVLDVPPTEVHCFKAKLVSIEPGPKDLTLTDEEWALYAGEDDA